MIARCLKKQGYKKVICFTYGCQGNKESKISKLVAESLDYPWVMVPYNNEMWQNLKGTKELEDYMRWAFSYISVPHLGDFAAVKYMKEQKMLPNDSVFIPGYSGDLIAGSHITKEYTDGNLSLKNFKRVLVKQFYHSAFRFKNDIKLKLEAYLKGQDLSSVEKMENISECFNIQNRQAKFIVNSCRVYEFFG